MCLRNQSQYNLPSRRLLSPAIEDTAHEQNQSQSKFNENADNQLLSQQELINKASEILSKTSNDPETEKDFRRICELYKSHNYASDPVISKAYQEYIGAYHQISSIYLMEYDGVCKTYVYVYDTEDEKETVKELCSWQNLDIGTCIARIPNGELFCLGKEKIYYGFALIIDKNLRTRLYLSGTLCRYSSAIYYNRNVYCFGGEDEKYNSLILSDRFDLDKNAWFKLSPMPQACSSCTSLIFNGNILISLGYQNNIIQYSIEIDSFSIINYDFEGSERKIIMKAEKRLYLIALGWDSSLVYESGVGDEYTWKKIGNSTMSESLLQVYALYNKGGFYIAQQDYCDRKYYKFDLDQKILIDLTDD